MQYFKLFWSFFQIGLFSFGGGYATLPLIEEQIVHINNWLTANEFLDVVTISQMTPGPIAINAATFVGNKIGGTFGAALATLGCITAPCIIVFIITYLYYKYKDLWGIKGILSGLRPAVVSLIASAALSIVLLSLFNGEASSWFSINPSLIDINKLILFIISVLIFRLFKVDPIYIMLGTGIIGLML